LKVNWFDRLEDKLSVLEERLLFLEGQVTTISKKFQAREQELEQRNRQLQYAHEQMLEQHRLVALGSLVAGILHETNNPLQLTIGFAQLSSFLIENLKNELKEDFQLFDRQKQEKVNKIILELEENVSTIDFQSTKISENINSMLLQARIAGSQRTKIDLNRSIERSLPIVIHSYKFQNEDFTIKLETDFDRALGTIEVFAEDITKIIVNLVKNACDSMFQKKRRLGEFFQPHLLVKTKKLDERFLAIIIRDNGEGIPDNLKARIFQPYITTKSAGKGTGLGLSIVSDLLKNNNGQIKLQAQWGSYAEFTIILPIKN
jgi:signal transduction histidine kinase